MALIVSTQSLNSFHDSHGIKFIPSRLENREMRKVDLGKAHLEQGATGFGERSDHEPALSIFNLAPVLIRAEHGCAHMITFTTTNFVRQIRFGRKLMIVNQSLLNCSAVPNPPPKGRDEWMPIRTARSKAPLSSVSSEL